MKILIVGGGAREHALARAFHLDPAVDEVHAAPGNPGIGQIASLHHADPNHGPAIAVLATDIGADL
ncbi:MAG: phosphoribosylamine--glycine ligase N-terminal domain-containing protein, partial [Demequina sp.]